MPRSASKNKGVPSGGSLTSIMRITEHNKIFVHKDVEYVHAPKVGSRSIIGWFAILKKPDLHKQHPEWFKPVDKGVGQYKDIRAMMNVQFESESNHRFCVKRDPVKRFISGFKNRVHTHDECEVKDFDEFVDRFEEIYGENKSIWVHFRPQSLFYGSDQSIYERIFRTENLDECREWLSNRFNQDLPVLHLQQNVPVEVNPTEKQRQKIEQFYKQDYKNRWY